MYSIYHTAPGSVVLTDPVLAPRLRSGLEVTIPAAVAKCRETGRIDAFKLNWHPGQEKMPHIFWDSDLAKTLEGMALSLRHYSGKERIEKETELEQIVSLVISAQQPDGYLNTHFTVVEPEKRWTNIARWHELYCAGHLMEAAVAHFYATGKRHFLDCLCRYADYIGKVFGLCENQLHGYPGHEEIELALCKLAEASGNEAYYRLASYFVNERGRKPSFFEEQCRKYQYDLRYDLTYFQAHLPVREQTEAMGHAVRAVYLYCGMTDVAMHDNDPELLQAAIRLYRSIAERKMYLTGGIGDQPHGEALGPEYHLSNETCYAESCASIGFALFCDRLFRATGETTYIDTLEQVLYNNICAGIDLHGDRFFYGNPTEVYPAQYRSGVITADRKPWYDTSCCPTNFARFLMQIEDLIWYESADALYLNLPAASVYHSEKAEIEVQSAYPNDGKITLKIKKAPKTLLFRIPGWCRSFTVLRKGKACIFPQEKGFLKMTGLSDGETIEINLAMPVQLMRADLRIAENAGRGAVKRGPLVYALEECDNGALLSALILDKSRIAEARLTPVPELPEGTCCITLPGWREENPGTELYFADEPIRNAAELHFVPYALWGNRKVGELRLFVRLDK